MHSQIARVDIYTTINVLVLPCDENNRNISVVDDLPCVHVSRLSIHGLHNIMLKKNTPETSMFSLWSQHLEGFGAPLLSMSNHSMTDA